MYLRIILNRAFSVVAAARLIALLSPALLAAQEHPARRLSSIVGVAVEEYGKGIDASGRVISDLEYQEAVDFLQDARGVAERLSGERAPAVRSALDSLIVAVSEKRPPAAVATLNAAFVAALGSEGALELPEEALSLASGRELYARNCASCHGERGMGDGPAARGMNPPPSPLGDATAMVDATPALLYRVISVGIAGTQMAGWATQLSPQQRWNIVAYLHSLRASEAALLEGEGLFLQRCAACHGATGAGAGSAAAARSLTRLPPEIASFAWQAERSDAQLAQAIRAGVPGSAMPPSRDLTDADLAKVVAYVRSLPVRNAEVPVAAAAVDSDATAVAQKVLSTLDLALAAAQSGRADDASERGFDAYIAFEPLETPARARDPGLVATMERHFADFRAAVKAGDVRSAASARDAIEAGLPAVVDLTKTPSGSWAAFFQSLLIILR
ncbi:MAG: c-type cytochrome, partial [Gemmatimonadaceae bacterium]